MNKNLTHQISRAALTLLLMLAMSLTASATIITLSPNGTGPQLFDGDTLTGTGGTNTRIEILDGATVTLSNVTALNVNNFHQWAGITCLGNATIVLAAGTTNTVEGGVNFSGIYVPEGHTLTIQGSGTLIATGGQFGAGIGSGFGIIDDINYSLCGNIIISGGTVTANGGHYATGIGSSYKNSDGGSITISGGTVTATGGQYGAGIGSGYKNSDCGNITISGGTVTATGGQYGAGIGSGYYYSECSTITINGGTVTANGSQYAAAIGSGYDHSDCWHMFFGGGTITANGDERAAGIGSGYKNSSCRDITITNGVTQITASALAFYTIGPGDESTCGYITINSYEIGFITQNPFTTFPYYIDFDANGGTGFMGGMLVMYNLATALPPNDYTRPGYLFGGWATSANGPILYYDEQSVSNLAQTSGATVTLYAKWASIPGELLLHDGDTLTGTGGPHTHVSIADGATVTFSGVDITAILEDNNHHWPGITCLGDAVIVLAEGTTNSVKGGFESPGIYVPQNKTLTLQGSGTLNATGNNTGAGIGSGYQQTCGNITIQGSGTLNATGGEYGTGIGSGYHSSCGNITIQGSGTLNATGGKYAAGIGSGYDHSDCGNITIQGSGTLNATGGNYAAGIGNGYDHSSCGTVTISGGTVTATGGDYAAGIGSGYDNSNCGNINITGGTVTATGGGGAAGIGSSCNNITISGGFVTAHGGENAAGIGSGYIQTCGNITINGGTVTANGGQYAPGIGSGYNGSSCGNITISGSTVTVSGGQYAAGIGSGYNNAKCGTVTITNGVTLVTATKGSGANNAIGAGLNSSCRTVTIGGVQTGFITQSPFTTFPYTVSFNANGGTGTMADMSFMYSFAQNLTANSFTLSGAEYEGWATTPDGPKVYDDGQSVNNLTQTSGATVTLYAKWGSFDPAHLSVSGNEYTIHTTTGWDLFCALLAGNSAGFFTGKTVKLAADITVTTMAGSWTSDSDYHAFTGTFNGQGHTLTLNYSSNETHCAPFRVIDGATIQNLHLAGTINAGDQFAAMVGHSYGDCNFTNCRSSITINSSRSGYGTHGGFVGRVRTGTSNFVGCVFDGFFSGPNTHAWGGFVGHVESTSHANFTDCLFAPANTSFDFDTYDSQTFARLRYDNPAYATFTNCYYTKVLGGAQGIQAYSITGATYVTVAFSGQATTTYSVSGIGVFSSGIVCGNTLYVSDGTTVSLNLGCNPGYLCSDFVASAGTLTGTTNPYTLTMPAENVLITATWAPDPTHFEQTDTDEYTIHTASGWDVFCNLLAENSNGYFTGKTVKLGVDISVTRMAGDSNHAFSGTFNGQGHTLTVSYNTTEEVTAPFRYVNGATITDLVTAGTISTSRKYAGGIIGRALGGAVSITNCVSGVTINSSVNGDGTHGGFVGLIQYTTLTITGSMFSGEMLGASTTLCGGFVGWTQSSNSTTTITNCLFAPTTLQISSGHTFSRASDQSAVTITNSYYTEPLDVPQGMQAVTHEAISAVGEATTYDVSGISAYVNGMQYGTSFYYNPDRNFLRSVAGYGTDGGWQLIASPLQSTVTPAMVGNLIADSAARYDLYRLEQAAPLTWHNHKSDSAFMLEAGKGYLYANADTVTLVFTGMPYIGDSCEVVLSYDPSDERKCWNLVGNPFNCNATLDREYYVLTTDSTGINPEPIPAATPIPPCTAVFVKAVEVGDRAVFVRVTQ
jgi:uncharacterized repeat protein (TIGR02543 family)